MSKCPPYLFAIIILAPKWIVMIIVPLMLFARNTGLRKYVFRSLAESQLLQRLCTFFALHNSVVVPS